MASSFGKSIPVIMIVQIAEERSWFFFTAAQGAGSWASASSSAESLCSGTLRRVLWLNCWGFPAVRMAIYGPETRLL